MGNSVRTPLVRIRNDGPQGVRFNEGWPYCTTPITSSQAHTTHQNFIQSSKLMKMHNDSIISLWKLAVKNWNKLTSKELLSASFTDRCNIPVLIVYVWTSQIANCKCFLSLFRNMESVITSWLSVLIALIYFVTINLVSRIQ
jgi:hypothetical protein